MFPVLLRSLHLSQETTLLYSAVVNVDKEFRDEVDTGAYKRCLIFNILIDLKRLRMS